MMVQLWALSAEWHHYVARVGCDAVLYHSCAHLRRACSGLLLCGRAAASDAVMAWMHRTGQAAVLPVIIYSCLNGVIAGRIAVIRLVGHCKGRIAVRCYGIHRHPPHPAPHRGATSLVPHTSLIATPTKKHKLSPCPISPFFTTFAETMHCTPASTGRHNHLSQNYLSKRLNNYTPEMVLM